MTTVTVLAPAKLNLGLEVIGKRADGYHEIATVIQTVSVFDRLIVRPGDDIDLHVSDPQLAGEDNLVLVAARHVQTAVMPGAGASFRLIKRIPSAAGLGGASSDAAAALNALTHIWSLKLERNEKQEVAARIGSDVPFLLEGGTALVRGRGDLIDPVRHLTGVWFVIVVPDVLIPRKTATLYGALSSSDFTLGDRAGQLAADLDGRRPLDSDLLVNAFQRPLYTFRPNLSSIERTMRTAGAPFVALSGAGPAHYTIVADLTQACGIALNARRMMTKQTRIMVCRPVAQAPLMRHDDS